MRRHIIWPGAALMSRGSLTHGGFSGFQSCRRRPGAQGGPAHAPPRLRLRPRQQGARHPGDPGLARTSIDHHLSAVYTALAPKRFKGFLAGVKTSGVGGTPCSERFSEPAVVQCTRCGVANFTDESMSEEFACPVCDSPAIVYPEEGEEDRIVCGGCGAFVATRDQFRRLVERHAEVQTSGC
jgi:hypothetical protein